MEENIHNQLLSEKKFIIKGKSTIIKLTKSDSRFSHKTTVNIHSICKELINTMYTYRNIFSESMAQLTSLLSPMLMLMMNSENCLDFLGEV